VSTLTLGQKILANIYVKGSAEGFGLNALEAVICGQIVLSSDLQGLKDTIKDNVNGFMLEPKNPIAWKNKIEEISSLQFNKKDFIKKAQKYTLNNFTWDKISKNIKKFIITTFVHKKATIL
jgi:glycosyltransferase involved in cell wall biosynthesis